jgi:hypothetical protein
MVHKAKDLSPVERRVIESLTGHTIIEQDDISVRTLTPPAQLSAERRQAILDKLNQYFAQIDAQRQPVSAEEADAILNEAFRSTRPGYRPVR